MDSFLKSVFIRAGKHTTVHGMHPHIIRTYFFSSSDAYSTDDLILYWKEADPVEVNDELELPQFDLTGFNHMDCNRHYTTGK